MLWPSLAAPERHCGCEVHALQVGLQHGHRAWQATLTLLATHSSCQTPEAGLCKQRLLLEWRPQFWKFEGAG